MIATQEFVVPRSIPITFDMVSISFKPEPAVLPRGTPLTRLVTPG